MNVKGVSPVTEGDDQGRYAIPDPLAR